MPIHASNFSTSQMYVSQHEVYRILYQVLTACGVDEVRIPAREEWVRNDDTVAVEREFNTHALIIRKIPSERSIQNISRESSSNPQSGPRP